MMEDKIRKIDNLVSALQRQNRRLGYGICILFIVWLGTLAVMIIPKANAAGAATSESTLRVRKLVVVDENGTERVVISAPIPNPAGFGKRILRGDGSPGSGMLFLDGEGNEQGGIITGEKGGIFIGLDSLDNQKVSFSTQPDGGLTSFRIYDNDVTGERNEIDLGVDRNKGPHLKFTRRGKTVLELPETKGGQ